MSVSGQSPITEGLVQPSDQLLQAVKELTEKSGHPFQISAQPVPGTSLFVVHTPDHAFRSEYTVTRGVLGFRSPINFPDAGPDDSFFIMPFDVKLLSEDAVRKNTDLNRASRADNFVTGSALGNAPVLLFSWHLWEKTKWNRRVHTLVDHYTHCIRRFEQPEHD
jgi:hypothetical protein